jgi:hypothetical protein
MAAGQHLIKLDHDDTLIPDALELLKDALVASSDVAYLKVSPLLLLLLLLAAACCCLLLLAAHHLSSRLFCCCSLKHATWPQVSS